MKKILLICIFYSSFIPFTMHGMEQNGIVPVYYSHHTAAHHTTPVRSSFSEGGSLESLVSIIDSEISKRYKIEIFRTTYPSDITPHGERKITDAAYIQDIISILHRYCPQPNDTIFSDLSEKNNVFKTILDHLISLAYQDIENVTCNTLEAIEHPELKRPTKELNTLPLAIKKYVMQKAKRKISTQYDRTFNHEDTIIYINTSKSGLFVTVSDNDFKVWDFNKIEPCRFTETIIDLHAICLNTNGSRLAASTYSKNQSTLKEWDTTTGNLNFSTTTPGRIYLLAYADNPTETTLISCSKDNGSDINQMRQTIWSIKNNTPSCIISMAVPGIQMKLFHSNEQDPHLSRISGDYVAYAGTSHYENLYVTKRNCHALKLCELAIQSAQKRRSLEKVTHSQSFQSLTEYEKDMVRQQMEEKRKTLAAKLQQKKKTNTTETKQLISTNSLTKAHNGTNTTTPKPALFISQTGSGYMILPGLQ